MDSSTERKRYSESLPTDLKLSEYFCRGNMAKQSYDHKVKRYFSLHGYWPHTPLRECACGCNEWVKSKDKNVKYNYQHHCRGKIPHNKGIPASESQKRKQSESMKGSVPWNKDMKGDPDYPIRGREYSEEHIQKVVESRRNNGKPWHSEETKQKIGDANKGKEISQKVKQKMSERLTGRPQTQEHIEKRICNRRGENHPLYGIGHTKETREKMSRSRVRFYLESGNNFSSKHYKTGYFSSHKNNKDLWFRSSYELRAYEKLEQDDNVLNYEPEPFALPYEFEGITRNTIPDILATYNNGKKLLIEVKPNRLLSDPKNKAKFQAMRNYAKTKEIEFSIWTEDII